jgi:DNA-binding response OmpR family regulator
MQSMNAMLIVEDDDQVRGLLYDMFADWRVCHVAATAEQALRYLEEEDYDVILTDISMPGLSGVELLGRVRRSWPEVPVIVITGIDDRVHAAGLLRLGAAGYVSKPFRLEEVEETVRLALERREQSLRLGRGRQVSKDE